MSYKLLPRFQYTLSIRTYLKTLFKQHKQVKDLPYDLNKVYFLNTARSGLKVLLDATGKKSMMVGVSVYTCDTVMQAIQLAGHEIIFIDINDRFQLDLEDLKHKSAHIDLLIATHTFGYPERFDQIRSIIGDKIIIEDCAHSFLTMYGNKLTGTLGDAAIFSMGIGKFPPVGQGGFILINNPSNFSQITQVIKLINKPNPFFQFNSQVKTLLISVILKPPIYGALIYSVGKKLDKRFDFLKKKKFNIKTGNAWYSAVLKNNFTIFEELLVRQQNNAETLIKSISNPIIILPKHSKGANNYIFPVIVENGRDSLYNELINKHIEVGKHFCNALRLAEQYGYKKGTCPSAENISLKILTLPVHSLASNQQLSKCAKILNEFQNYVK